MKDYKPYAKIALVAVLVGFMAFGSVYKLTKTNNAGLLTRNACEQDVTCVALKVNHADPDAITVPIGGYVQFNSADNKTHSLASGSGDNHHNGSHKHNGTHVSGDFKADEGWKVQFNKTGTYEFHDHYNPEVYITVVVYQPGGDYKIKP
jgi:plastocyanin